MLLIGLTGGIGSGKSTVSAMLAERGAVIIDADKIARDVVEPGTEGLAKIVERFGEGVLGPDGALNRPALAEIVFNDAQAKADLEAITHPAIGVVMAEQMAAQADTDHVVVLDVPLLVESGRSDMAGIIVVDTPEDVAVTRLVEQRGMAEDDARRRIANQIDREARRAKASVVIDNRGSREDLVAQVDAAWAWAQEQLAAG
jgi:dephospho-CoA kinase